MIVVLDLIEDGLLFFRRPSYESIESEVDTTSKLFMRVSVAHIGIRYFHNYSEHFHVDVHGRTKQHSIARCMNPDALSKLCSFALPTIF